MIYYYIKNKELITNENIERLESLKPFFSWLKEKKVVQIDTETEGNFDHIKKTLCVQFGDKNDQFVIQTEMFSKEDIYHLNILLANENLVKLFQNAAYDLKYLWRHDIYVKGPVWDTLIAEKVLVGGRTTPKGYYALDSIARRRLGIYLKKEIRGRIHKVGLTEEVVKYAAEDVKHLEDIYLQQLEESKKEGLYSTQKLEMAFLFPLSTLEYKGIYLDVIKWKNIQEKINETLQEKQQELIKSVVEEPKLNHFWEEDYDLFGYRGKKLKINLNSPVQKMKMLRILDPSVTSTSRVELTKRKNKHVIFKKLIEYAEIIKLKTAFADKLMEHLGIHQRIYPSINQLVSTGRVSYSNPNLQQIPARSALGSLMRTAFTARTGYLLVGADYSQIELRIAAELSKDPIWIEAFQQNKDLHTVLCAKTFNIKEEDVRTRSPYNNIPYRDVQKTINFGLIYGMGPFKLADTLEIQASEAEKIINKFFSEVPVLKEYLDKSGKEGVLKKQATTPLGRKRKFDVDLFDFKSVNSTNRKAKNARIQGCSADITKLALVLIYKELELNNYIFENTIYPVLTVHDEIVLEAKIGYENIAKEILEKNMEKAGKFFLKVVPVSVESYISTYWKK